MKPFAFCLIVGAFCLFYAETIGGGAFAIPDPNETSARAFTKFFETQAVLVVGCFIPWVAATLGLTLLLRKQPRRRRRR